MIRFKMIMSSVLICELKLNINVCLESLSFLIQTDIKYVHVVL